MFFALHLALKDLRLLLRDRMALFWALVFPVLFAVFIGSVLSSGISRESAKLPLVVVDEAQTEASRALQRSVADSGGLELRSAANVGEAESRVRRGESVAYLLLPSDFATTGKVRLGTDPSRSNEAGLVRSSLLVAMSTGGRAAAAPVPIDDVAVLRGPNPPSSFHLVFPAAILWGLMGCAATFAIAMVSERTGGTFIRLRAAPVGATKILAGKALACALACIADALILLGVARLGFGVELVRPGALTLALGSVTVCFVGLTMFLSTLGRTEQSVAGAGWATLLLMAMLGGAMVPVAFMPEWMQRLSDLSPVKWGIYALEGAIWRGLSASDLAVPCAILVAVGALGFGLGAGMMRRGEA